MAPLVERSGESHDRECKGAEGHQTEGYPILRKQRRVSDARFVLTLAFRPLLPTILFGLKFCDASIFHFLAKACRTAFLLKTN